ncbi:MAG: Gldg family protein [Burkholderiales bacterium]
MVKNKGFENLLYSAGGVIALFVILLAVNFIGGAVPGRADLTHGNAYTLSDGTKRILEKIPAPVKVRFYSSKSETAMPVQLKTYAKRIEDLLNEYKARAKGKLMLEKYDPAPDSDAEDSANLDGIEAQPINTGDKFYLGLSVSYLDKRVAIPLLSPERETLLEYDLTRAISQVSKPAKPVLGIMTVFPMFGSPGVQMMNQPPQPTWAVVNELQRDYEVREVPMGSTRIDDDVKVLMVVHPRDISDSAQYAIDQFLLRGGKLIAFLDTYAYFDQMKNPVNPQIQMGGGASNLEKLFSAWGIKLDPSKVVADMQYMRTNAQRTLPTLLNLTAGALNSQDVVTSQVGTMLLPFAGSFSGKPVAGLTQTVLIKSSTSAELRDSIMATHAVDPNGMTLKAAGVEYPIAIRLNGKFKTAFPDGQPKSEPPVDPNNPEAKPEAPKRDEKPRPHIKESAQDNAVVLIADADMLSDQASIQDIGESMGERVYVPRNGNINFAQSLVELFAGDENLINLRSRAAQFRPLTVVQQMEAKAAESYADKIRELEQTLSTAQRKISELQKTKTEGQQFILSPEQKIELENFRKKQVDTRKDLKELRKSLRIDSDSLEFWTKLINVGAMPLLVALAGIALAMIKRRRVAAQ